MARLPAGVVVISARFAGGYRGLTASSLVSVSVDPPMVMVGLEREAIVHQQLANDAAGRVLNLLDVGVDDDHARGYDCAGDLGRALAVEHDAEGVGGLALPARRLARPQQLRAVVQRRKHRGAGRCSLGHAAG